MLQLMQHHIAPQVYHDARPDWHGIAHSEVGGVVMSLSKVMGVHGMVRRGAIAGVRRARLPRAIASVLGLAA